MTPQQARAELARGQGLNQLAERYASSGKPASAASKPGSAATAQMARHFQHEDALYSVKGAGSGARTPAQAMALHFKHEDALYGAQRSAVAPSAASAASNGFTWNDALVGAGGAVGLILLSGAAVVAVQRGRGRVAQS